MRTSQHIVAVSVRVVHICSSKSWLTRTNATGRNDLQTAKTIIPRKKSCSRYATIDDFSCTETQADGSYSERIPKRLFFFLRCREAATASKTTKNCHHDWPAQRTRQSLVPSFYRCLRTCLVFLMEQPDQTAAASLLHRTCTVFLGHTQTRVGLRFAPLLL
jgi:hypothetical protein